MPIILSIDEYLFIKFSNVVTLLSKSGNNFLSFILYIDENVLSPLASIYINEIS